MADPEMVLLDEPAGGVNPTMIRFIMDLIRTLNRQQGNTFLIVEHNMGLVMELCDNIVVLELRRKDCRRHADVKFRPIRWCWMPTWGTEHAA